MKKDLTKKDFTKKDFGEKNFAKRIIATLLCMALAFSLAACTSKNVSSQDSSDSIEEKEARLKEALREVLDDSVTENTALAPSAFMTAAGEPGYQFKGQETMELTSRISRDGKYFLSFSIWGDDGAQVEINSDALGLKNETVDAASDDKDGLWKLLELSAGEYTFTARSLDGGNCSVMAVAWPVEELPELSDLTMENDFPGAYLCKMTEGISLDYIFRRDEREEQVTYGPMAVFYHVGSHEELGTVNLEYGASEAKGSIDIPKGDILIKFNTSDWSMKFN